MKDIYTDAVDAIEVIESRRKDTELSARVSEYLGDVLPSDCFDSERPVAMLARYVPRATEEDRVFADIARQLGFVPYWASYLGDQYTSWNPEKVDTIRPPIRWQKGQRTRSWIVERDKRVGGVGELETIYGYSSVVFQEGIRKIVMEQDGQPELIPNVFDMGDWYKVQAAKQGHESGARAPYYYPALMALATKSALFEDFDGGPNSSNNNLTVFRNKVVYPAFDKVEKELGLRPVIVRLAYQDGFGDTDLSLLDRDQAETFQSLGSLAVQF